MQITINDKENIITLLKTGLTFEQVGKEYGVIKQTIDAFLKKHCPEIDRSALGVKIRTKNKIENKRLSNIEKYGRETGHPQNELERKFGLWFSQKKRNVKSNDYTKHLEFSIAPNDLLTNCVIPLVCPYLEIELNWFNTKLKGNSPSIDRVDNYKGYIKSNVIICSAMANSIKRDSTLDELKSRKYVKNLTLLNTLIKNLELITKK